jgi:hypothetical protein
LATWRSNLKKIVISVAPSAYGLSPPVDIPVEECAPWVEAPTKELLDGGRFLHFWQDQFGKTRNFVHPALLQVIILFFYTGTYCVAHRQPAIFQKEVPLKYLALVCTVVHPRY